MPEITAKEHIKDFESSKKARSYHRGKIEAAEAKLKATKVKHGTPWLQALLEIRAKKSELVSYCLAKISELPGGYEFPLAERQYGQFMPESGSCEKICYYAKDGASLTRPGNTPDQAYNMSLDTIFKSILTDDELVDCARRLDKLKFPRAKNP